MELSFLLLLFVVLFLWSLLICALDRFDWFVCCTRLVCLCLRYFLFWVFSLLLLMVYSSSYFAFGFWFYLLLLRCCVYLRLFLLCWLLLVGLFTVIDIVFSLHGCALLACWFVLELVVLFILFAVEVAVYVLITLRFAWLFGRCLLEFWLFWVGCLRSSFGLRWFWFELEVGMWVFVLWFTCCLFRLFVWLFDFDFICDGWCLLQLDYFVICCLWLPCLVSWFGFACAGVVVL